MHKTLQITVVFLIIITSTVNANAKDLEPIQMGAFIGQLPLKVDRSKSNGYPLHYGTWAGNLFLYKKKLEIQEWVNQNKTTMIKAALKEAKKYAQSNTYKYFAIDNITFQIIQTKNQAELFFDCNIIAWK